MLRDFAAYYAPRRRLFLLDFGCAVLSGLLALGFPIAGTIRNADRIVVIADVRVDEHGSHAELVAQEGLYHRLGAAQTERLHRPGFVAG